MQNIFGSVCHVEQAIIKSVEREQNNGWTIGCIKAAKNQFGGKINAALCVLLLKLTVQVFSKIQTFLKLKKHKSMAVCLSKECVMSLSLLFAKLFN